MSNLNICLSCGWWRRETSDLVSLDTFGLPFVPLLGFTITPFDILSDRMPNGDLSDSIKPKSNSDCLRPVSVSFICVSDVANTPTITPAV